MIISKGTRYLALAVICYFEGCFSFLKEHKHVQITEITLDRPQLFLENWNLKAVEAYQG